MRVVFFAVLIVCIVVGGLAAWRFADLRRDTAEMDRLRSFAVAGAARFDPGMVAELPAPVRRYFEAAIRPGTPLYQVAEIEMTGVFDLGTRDARKPLAMSAYQVLAGAKGFLWQARMSGGMKVSGSDSESWTRFWLAGLVPVARAGGDPDHHRSAFGRSVAEAVIWLPTSVLPQPGVTWEAVNQDVARVTIQRDGLEQSAEVTLDAQGHAISVMLMRWSNVNPDKVYRLQPFGGTLSDHRDFGGVTVPAHAEVGNHVGTDAYFPFFISDLTRMTYPAND